MGLFDSFKQNIQEFKRQLSERDALAEQRAQDKAKITMAHIERYNITQEIQRTEKTKKAADQVIEDANATPEEKAKARATVEQTTKKIKQKQKEYDKQTQKIKTYSEKADKKTDKMRSIVVTAVGDLFKSNARDIKDATLTKATSTREGLEKISRDVADAVISTPSRMKERAKTSAEKILGAIHDMNDAFENAVHNTHEKGLIAFAELEHEIPAIDRVYRDMQIKSLEKDYEKDQKIEKVLEQIEKVTDLKVQQAKTVGSAVKQLFTGWKPEQAKQEQAAQDPIDQINKELTERKPGFLRRIILQDKADIEKEIISLCKEQMKAYDQIIAENKDKYKDYDKTQYRTLDQVVKHIERENQREKHEMLAKALEYNTKQVQKAKAKDDMTR